MSDILARSTSRTRLATARSHRGNAWKQWRSKLNAPTFGVTIKPDADCVTVETTLVDAWRDVGSTPDILGRNFGGWYADAYQDELYCGHVWQLPARNGECVYLAGRVEPDSGYAVLDVSRGQLRTFDDKDDAARAGDALAERHAETEREHSERWSEASVADEKRQDARNALRNARKDASAVIAALREQGDVAPGVCAILRRSLDTARDTMRTAIERIAECGERIESLDMTGEF